MVTPRLHGAPHGFAAALPPRANILYVEFGGLGDHLHSLPALKLLREARPEARITALVSGAGSEIFSALVPWIDTVCNYDRRGFGADAALVGRLRAQRFDAAIQLMQSNRGTWFVAFSGARLKLVRRNDETKPWHWQPWVLSHVVEQPYHQFPKYLQRWRCLRDAGFDGAEPRGLADTGVRVDAEPRRALGICADDERYLHCSASASDDLRDLPPSQMIELWNALHRRFPEHRFVITAAPTPRARRRLATLLAGIDFTPWQVFAGSIGVPAFASVMQGAALHVGPDSGGLHVARLVGTPSVSWFRPNHHLANWLPDEAGHLAFTAPESRPDGLHGLPTATLVDAAARLLASATGPRQIPAV